MHSMIWMGNSYEDMCNIYMLPKKGTHTFKVCNICGRMYFNSTWARNNEPNKIVILKDYQKDCEDCNTAIALQPNFSRWVLHVAQMAAYKVVEAVTSTVPIVDKLNPDLAKTLDMKGSTQMPSGGHI